MSRVPQSKYDTDYYVHNCDGYTDDGTMCRRLNILLSHYDFNTIQKLNVIDIGCGRGETAKYVSSFGHNVFAVDYSYSACQLFEKNCGDKIPFLRHDVSYGFPWIKDNYFDVAILADVVEHLYAGELQVLGMETVRVLNKERYSGGVILIDTPIMNGGESELHVDIKASVDEVAKYFPGYVVIKQHWYKNPEHCNIVMVKK